MLTSTLRLHWGSLQLSLKWLEWQSAPLIQQWQLGVAGIQVAEINFLWKVTHYRVSWNCLVNSPCTVSRMDENLWRWSGWMCGFLHLHQAAHFKHKKAPALQFSWFIRPVTSTEKLRADNMVNFLHWLTHFRMYNTMQEYQFLFRTHFITISYIFFKS